MWLLTFLLVAATLLIGWMLFGYFILLWLLAAFRPKKKPVFPTKWPRLSIIVPCYNERDEILDKLENVRALQYADGAWEVVFADGGSTDGTTDLLCEAIGEGEPFRLVRCPRKGKIHQINHVLGQLTGEIVVNTDVDARLAPDALQWLAAEFALSPDVAVVGAYVRPAAGLDIEMYHWDAMNKGRFLETDAHTSSIAIAPCYGFRRTLLAAFPEDVVADDIYVAYLAHAKGFRAVYSRRAMALEHRCPSSYEDFLPHKYRKSNAYLRESLRFLYVLPEMDAFCRFMMLTRVAQQLLLPWAMLFWVIIAATLVTLFRYDLVIYASVLLAVLFILTSRVFAQVDLPGEDRWRRHRLDTVITGYVLTLVIMLITGITYPLFRQGSSYAKLPQADAADAAREPARSAAPGEPPPEGAPREQPDAQADARCAPGVGASS